MITTEPSPPASRYSCAAMPAASPPPTITFWMCAMWLSSFPAKGAQRDDRQHTGDAQQYAQVGEHVHDALVTDDGVAQPVGHVVQRQHLRHPLDVPRHGGD